MLRPRSAAGVTRRDAVIVRVHVLQKVRRWVAEGPLPELRRRVAAPPEPAGRQACEISGVDGAQGETAGLRRGLTMAFVMAGLVPAIPIRMAHCSPKRDARHKAGHDESECARMPLRSIAGCEHAHNARRCEDASDTARSRDPFRVAVCTPAQQMRA